MKNKIVAISLSSVLLLSSFSGCSAKNCNPSTAGFIGGIGCNLSGAYDERLSIFGVRFNIAKDKYLKTLLDYQEMVAEATNDRTQITQLKTNIEIMNREANQIEAIILEIEEDEKVIEAIQSAPQVAQKKKAPKVKKKVLSKKLTTFSKSVERVGKSSIVSKKQKKLVLKKMKSGILSKTTTLKLKKLTANNGAILAKAESHVLKTTQQTMFMVSSLKKSVDNDGNSKELKQNAVGLLLRSKAMVKSKKIHSLETKSHRKLP